MRVPKQPRPSFDPCNDAIWPIVQRLRGALAIYEYRPKVCPVLDVIHVQGKSVQADPVFDWSVYRNFAGASTEELEDILSAFNSAFTQLCSWLELHVDDGRKKAAGLRLMIRSLRKRMSGLDDWLGANQHRSYYLGDQHQLRIGLAWRKMLDVINHLQMLAELCRSVRPQSASANGKLTDDSTWQRVIGHAAAIGKGSTRTDPKSAKKTMRPAVEFELCGDQKSCLINGKECSLTENQWKLLLELQNAGLTGLTKDQLERVFPSARQMLKTLKQKHDYLNQHISFPGRAHLRYKWI